MHIGRIAVTSRFAGSYRKIPKAIKERARERETIFRADPFDARLETHKLHGADREAWAQV
ncbi:MAG: hypothetical protein HYT34_00930 [Candidatus Ryanbacteria bacterium]|nr:hypothetical protein [Candidatus Ryanbacteria bacterium]